MNKGALTEKVQQLENKLAAQDMELLLLKNEIVEIRENEKLNGNVLVEIVKELKRLAINKQDKGFQL